MKFASLAALFSALLTITTVSISQAPSGVAGEQHTITSQQGGHSSGSNVGGKGGTVLVQPQGGGNGAAGFAAGAGGDLLLRSGPAGGANGGPGAGAGSISIDSGDASGSGLQGEIGLARTKGRGVVLGRAGIPNGTVVEGSFYTQHAQLGRPSQNDYLDVFGLVRQHYFRFSYQDELGALNHVVEVQQAPAGALGSQLTISAGIGGAATVSGPGQPGGTLYPVAGFGGAGTSTQAAGPGGLLRLAGGTAGTNLGGGGADGGDVSLEGGTPSGGGWFGSVLVGVYATAQVVLGDQGQSYPVLVDNDLALAGYADVEILSAAPSAPAAGFLRVYSRVISGAPALCYQDSSATEVCL